MKPLLLCVSVMVVGCSDKPTGGMAVETNAPVAVRQFGPCETNLFKATPGEAGLHFSKGFKAGFDNRSRMASGELTTPSELLDDYNAALSNYMARFDK